MNIEVKDITNKDVENWYKGFFMGYSWGAECMSDTYKAAQGTHKMETNTMKYEIGYIDKTPEWFDGFKEGIKSAASK